MKVLAVSSSVILVVSMLGIAHSGASRASDVGGAGVSGTGVSGTSPIALVQSLTATPNPIPSSTLSLINTCNCFSSVTRWQVSPVATPAEVFSSPDILFAILDLDIQLPWVGVGEVSSKPLLDRIRRSGLDALNAVLILGNRAGGIRTGLYAWSHPTAPDFCSGETLDLLYFPADGTLVAFRYDSSHEC